MKYLNVVGCIKSSHKHVPIIGIQFPKYFIIVQNEFEVVGVAPNK
jgi:hypothetical protein